LKHRFPDDHDCSSLSTSKHSKPCAKRQPKPGSVSSVRKATADGVLSQRGLKIERMRIKLKATGESTIPCVDRVSVRVMVDMNTVALPSHAPKPPFFIWLNGASSIGWNLDYVCIRIKLVNKMGDGICMARIGDGVESEACGELLPLSMSVECRKVLSDGDSVMILRK